MSLLNLGAKMWRICARNSACVGFSVLWDAAIDNSSYAIFSEYGTHKSSSGSSNSNNNQIM